MATNVSRFNLSNVTISLPITSRSTVVASNSFSFADFNSDGYLDFLVTYSTVSSDKVISCRP